MEGIRLSRFVPKGHQGYSHRGEYPDADKKAVFPMPEQELAAIFAGNLYGLKDWRKLEQLLSNNVRVKFEEGLPLPDEEILNQAKRLQAGQIICVAQPETVIITKGNTTSIKGIDLKFRQLIPKNIAFPPVISDKDIRDATNQSLSQGYKLLEFASSSDGPFPELRTFPDKKELNATELFWLALLLYARSSLTIQNGIKSGNILARYVISKCSLPYFYIGKIDQFKKPI